MGCAHGSLLGEGESFTTLELKINVLKPVWQGRLTAVGEVSRPGASSVSSRGASPDESGSLVAHATSTCLTLRGDAAQGR